MKFQASIGLSFQGTFNLLVEEFEASAQNEAPAAAAQLVQSLQNGCTIAQYSLFKVVSVARAKHDRMQEMNVGLVRSSRQIPRGEKDEVNNDTITLRFRRGLSHSMPVEGWLELIRRCRGNVNTARSIVANVASGTFENHLPAALAA